MLLAVACSRYMFLLLSALDMRCCLLLPAVDRICLFVVSFSVVSCPCNRLKVSQVWVYLGNLHAVV